MTHPSQLTHPLLTHASADSIVAWRKGKPVSVQGFLADMNRLASLLPAGQHMLNICRDRYHFAVGLAAAIVSQKISLLPPTHTPDMVQQLLTVAPDVFCLYDQEDCTDALPRLRYPQTETSADNQQQWTIPQIAAAQCVAKVFTSGSTGKPLPHAKSWGSLVRNVQTQAARLQLGHLQHQDAAYTIIGTIPPQHMYGFESTVLLALQSGNALSCEQPFYPADICSAIAAVPMPRVLVSTPLHLRLLLEAGLPLPAASLVLSATAPLSTQLAHKVEAAFDAPLLEIYGSTETGQIATRRTTQTAEWQLLPGIQLEERSERVWASQGHIEIPVALNDIVELTEDRHFLLHGRLQDLINIAGKRTSLANLDYHLNSIPGVIDGAFYMPDEDPQDHVTRLIACVVAPGLTVKQLLAELRTRIDAVFLPRPLLLVAALPRNSTGKLPRDILRQFINMHITTGQTSVASAGTQTHPQTSSSKTKVPHESQMKTHTVLNIAADHPAFAGHFPGTPIVPGVVLLDETLHAIATQHTQPGAEWQASAWQISSVKFLSPLLPGEPALLQYETLANGSIRFDVMSGERHIVTGSLTATKEATAK